MIAGEPSASDFRQWVEAIGKRYSGHYTPPGQSTPLPRVAFWSIWNEPNYGPEPHARSRTKNSARSRSLTPPLPQYRKLVEAGWQGSWPPAGTRPRPDTILIGETAPRGNVEPGRRSDDLRRCSSSATCTASDSRGFQPTDRLASPAPWAVPTDGSSARPSPRPTPRCSTPPAGPITPIRTAIDRRTIQGRRRESGRPPNGPTSRGWATSPSRRWTAVGRRLRQLGRQVVDLYNTEFGYFTNPPAQAPRLDRACRWHRQVRQLRRSTCPGRTRRSSPMTSICSWWTRPRPAALRSSRHRAGVLQTARPQHPGHTTPTGCRCGCRGPLRKLEPGSLEGLGLCPDPPCRTGRAARASPIQVEIQGSSGGFGDGSGPR